MAITVEPEGLASAGTGLASSASTVCGPTVCQPPAGDPVSAGVAAVFNSHATGVSTLLWHAAAQRAAGGASVTGDAYTLQAADEANAAAIAGGGPSPVGVAIPAAMAAIPSPVLPAIPTVPPAPPLPGEALATLVHSGPGPGGLRTMAQHLRDTAGRVQDLANDTRRYGTLIDQNWEDGRQRAGANVSDHADWLDGMHTHLSQLAAGADEAAGHAETLIQSTPHPQEFADLRQRLRTAVAQFNASHGLNPAPVAAVMSQIASKQSAAMTAHQEYYAAAATTTGNLPPMPTPSPSILGPEPLRQPPGDPQRQKEPSGGHGGKEQHSQKTGGEAPSDAAGQAVSTPESDGHGPALGVPADPPAPAPVAAGGSPLGQIGAEIAGVLVGTGTSAASQAAGAMRGLSQAPMAALSSLGMPNLGGMPDPGGMPGDGDGGMPDLGGSDGGDDHDFGSGGTTPAGAGGDAGGGAGGGIGSPAAGPAVSATPVVASPSAGLAGVAPTPQAGGPGGAGGMGMFPPFLGGHGGRQESERDKGKDRRVVLRPVPNSEPVFGALERQPPSARRRLEKQRQEQKGDT